MGDITGGELTEALRYTIEEMCAQSPYKKQLEVIPVVQKGRWGTVLLRVKTMRRCAYLLNNRSGGFKKSFIHIKLEGEDDLYSGRFDVSCGCGNCTHSVSVKPKTAELETICAKHGIETVFVRYAYDWCQNYGKPQHIQIVEACEAEKAMLTIYSPRTVKTGRRFIHPESRGV